MLAEELRLGGGELLVGQCTLLMQRRELAELVQHRGLAASVLLGCSWGRRWLRGLLILVRLGVLSLGGAAAGRIRRATHDGGAQQRSAPHNPWSGEHGV